MLTSTARLLVRTEESTAMPCSVKTSGLAPPKLRREDITFFDSRASISPVEFKQEVRLKAFRVAPHLLALGDGRGLIEPGQLLVE